MRTARGLKSMTGFGSGSAPIPAGRVTVEVRAVNQRFLDVRVSAPREYAPWETACREAVRARVARGRVEVSVVRGAPPARRVRIVPDLRAAREYAAGWRRLKRELGLTGELDLGLLRAAEVFQTVEVTSDAHVEFTAASRALARALAGFERERRREGRNLARDMRARIGRLGAIERHISVHAERVLPELQAKLEERMRRLLSGVEIDPARVTQEAAVLAERSDVTEELVRLRSHLEALRALTEGAEPAGKQIEFLLQEVHREINTLGSKTNVLAVTQLVVEAKGEVERLKEQVQNVE